MGGRCNSVVVLGYVWVRPWVQAPKHRQKEVRMEEKRREGRKEKKEIK